MAFSSAFTHIDEVTSMANEEKQTNRPKCDYSIVSPSPIRGEPDISRPCGSEERIYQVSTPAKDYWGNANGTNERNVCQKHLVDAWNSDATEAHPIDLPTGPK
jgi:hypothetical protein